MGSCCSSSKTHKGVPEGAGRGGVGASSACPSALPSVLRSAGQDDGEQKHQHRSGHRHAPEEVPDSKRRPLSQSASATEPHDTDASESHTAIPVEHAVASLLTYTPDVAATTSVENVHLDGIVLLEPVVTTGSSLSPNLRPTTDASEVHPQHMHQTLHGPLSEEEGSPARDAVVAASNPLSIRLQGNGEEKRTEREETCDPLTEPIAAALGARSSPEAVTAVTAVEDLAPREPLGSDEDLFGSPPNRTAALSTTDSRSVSCGSKSTDPSLVPTTFSSWSSAELAAAGEVPPLSPRGTAAAAGAATATL